MSSVLLKHVYKSYGSIDISKDINLEIDNGEFVVFVGPSGCGKSTLLRMIAGLEDITKGELYIGDKLMNDIPPAKRGIGMVFQSYALYPHMNVAKNMSFGLKLAGVKKEKITQKVDEIAKILQLENLLDRKPKDLSGGQRQRVAIGRTLALEPSVFLLDEPLSNLDASLRVQMRVEIAKLHKKLGCTMIYVTHDQTEAMTLANKIVVLNKGEISQVGKPLELYHYPQNMFVASFIGSPKMNFIEVVATNVSENSVSVSLPNQLNLTLAVKSDGVKQGDKLTLGIRPEHFLDIANSEMLNRQDIAYLDVKVSAIEILGNETQIYLEIEQDKTAITYRKNDIALLNIDDSFKLAINPKRCHLFKQDQSACPRLEKELGV